MVGPEEPGGSPDPAEGRVQALRDTLLRVAGRIDAGGEVRVAEEVHDPIHQACSALGDGDLGPDAPMIGMQFEALLERLRGVQQEHAGPVAPDGVGLPADARFLRDMADYLTRRYGLVTPGGEAPGVETP